jgi:hypothetical protein
VSTLRSTNDEIPDRAVGELGLRDPWTISRRSACYQIVRKGSRHEPVELVGALDRHDL